MSTTTRCLFALGLSVSLFAACGDDDDDGFGGGSGGRAGSSGGGGRAGTGGGGTGGTGGSTAGTGGSTAGTGGSTAGTGGSTAGTGGSGATGGSDPGDAGPDATPDGGDEPTDGGVEPIACPDLEDALADADGDDGQGVIIARVVFEGGNAVVTFKAINGDFNFAPPLQLCTGSELGDCDDGVQDLEGNGTVDGGVGDLLEGESIEFTTPLGDIVTAASGELALVNGQPGVDDEPIIRAYINWGDYLSLPPSAGDDDDLATEAEEEDVWDASSSIDVDGQTTIVADSDVTDENGFTVCTQEP